MPRTKDSANAVPFAVQAPNVPGPQYYRYTSCGMSAIPVSPTCMQRLGPPGVKIETWILEEVPWHAKVGYCAWMLQM